MKRIVAAIGAILLVGSLAQAGDQGKPLTTQAPTSIRTSAILTNADVNSTTFTLPADATAVRFYADFTIGSLTNVILTPIGQTGLGTAVYSANGKAVTLTASDSTSFRINAEDFPGRYVGIKAYGTGTTTNSLLVLKYKIEYDK